MVTIYLVTACERIEESVPENLRAFATLNQAQDWAKEIEGEDKRLKKLYPHAGHVLFDDEPTFHQARLNGDLYDLSNHKNAHGQKYTRGVIKNKVSGYEYSPWGWTVHVEEIDCVI